jgi:hypothetical protein
MRYIPTTIRPVFTWQDAAHRGLALLTEHPDTLLAQDQQDRLRGVFSKLLQEDGKDAYMVWEDLRHIHNSWPFPNYNPCLPAIVRHLRQVLRVRNLFGPELPNEHLLEAFGRWDDTITRTLCNVNQVVTTAPAVAGITVVLPPVWRTLFLHFDGLIASDEQILSCYFSYWHALSWPKNRLTMLYSDPHYQEPIL